MARLLLALLAVALASTLSDVQASAQDLQNPDVSIASSLVGRSLTTCPTSEKVRIRIPKHLVEHAKLKARLSNLLRESLYDDAKGIVNIARDKEIKDLANKLRK